MRLGVMLSFATGSDSSNYACFCKTEVETDVRCAWCKKLLAQSLSTPYSIKCPRCKMMRDIVGPCRSIGLSHPGSTLRGVVNVKGVFYASKRNCGVSRRDLSRQRFDQTLTRRS